MSSKSEVSEVMKVDRRGRVHVPVERREALLDEFERSGASAPEFARLVGINYSTFAGWRARRGRGKVVPVAAARAPVPLLEAVVEMPSPLLESGLVVELRGGGRLLVTAAEHVPWAAELLRLLQPNGGRPC